MAIVDVELAEESKNRYLTYALSVVSSRALPDARDGLKPVQRRILYAMQHNLHLGPDKNHRKSAAVVGEVLANYHPHGDSACYDAMVRMAQDFSLRYPLVDGQGNFGSLDGDSAAAYRYTEAKLTKFAIEVIGDIGQETVAERDNFDQTIMEPVVLPSRVPNLLVNGSSGIAVGMATAIPPHNLTEVIKALLKLIDDEDTSIAKLLQSIKGPDFPIGCEILNSKDELKAIYTTGRGGIRMRGSSVIETTKGKGARRSIVINSIPYTVDKSVLVAKIADFIIAKKLPQLVDVRDESTTDIRIVLELAKGADEKNALAFLYKNTSLQQNFNVNLTALIPTENAFVGRPSQLSIKDLLLEFLEFRVKVTRCKLEYEKRKLEERIHLLEGLEMILDVIDEVIKIVRKSSGRSDAAAKLQKRFKLSELQAFFIVDLRIYQLSRTNVDEVTGELSEKRKRVKAINKLLKTKKALLGEVATDLKRVDKEFGDARRSKVIGSYEEPVYDKESFIQHEAVHVVVTKDGWIKRIKASNDPSSTRIREGDALAYTREASTKDTLILFTNFGNTYGMSVFEMAATTGYGEPVQKSFKFKDGEQIVYALVLDDEYEKKNKQLILASERGYGFRYDVSQLGVTKKNGKRVMKVSKGDTLVSVSVCDKRFLIGVSKDGYCSCFSTNEITELNAGGKGVIVQKIPADDALVAVVGIDKKLSIEVEVKTGKPKKIDFATITIGTRAKRGLKLIKRGMPVLGARLRQKGEPEILSLF